MRGCDAWRDDESIVVRVHHDESSDESRAHAPTGRPGVLELTLAGLELNAGGFGEILTKEVRGSRLDGLAVLHHRLDTIGALGTWEALAFALLAAENRHGEKVAREGLVNAEHFHRFLLRFGAGFVGRVTLLPEKLGGAEKQTGPHFPADDIGPLVEKNREIAPGFHPAGVGGADDGLGCRAHDQRLGELTGGHEFAIAEFKPVMRHHRAFLGEAFHMGGFFFQIAERDEERKIRVLVSGGLEHPVQHGLHALPQGVAPGLDHHASPHLRVLSQIRRADDLLIPFWKILFPPRRDGCLLFLAHEREIIAGARGG